MQRGELCRFTEIRDVRLDRVEAVSRGAVRVIVADVGEQCIARPTEGGEVRGLGHVVVVVHPRGQHRASVEIERRCDRIAGLPTSGCAQKSAVVVDIGAL